MKSNFNAKQIHLFMQAATILSVLLLFGFAYGANTVLEQQSNSVKDAHIKSAVAERKQKQVAKAKADIAKYGVLAAISKNIVPQDKDQAQTVREIVGIADKNGIKLGSVTFPTSSLGATGPGSKNSVISQLTPNAAIPGVYSLDITIQSDPTALPPFTKFIDFLTEIEKNRRTSLVKSVSIQPDATNPANISFTLTVSENIKP